MRLRLRVELLWDMSIKWSKVHPKYIQLLTWIEKTVHPTVTVLPQSVPEILNKSDVEDSESKSDVETPVDTVTEPVKSPIIQKNWHPTTTTVTGP